MRSKPKSGAFLAATEPRARAKGAPRGTDIARRLALEHAATRVLAESASLAEAATAILRAVCENLGWACGTCWQRRPGTDALRAVAKWGIESRAIAKFLETSVSLAQDRQAGGLVRRAWTTGKPVGILEVMEEATFRRASAAHAAGLHSAFAFPVKVGEQVLAVMEFFSVEVSPPDEALLECATYVGSQIGQFCRRTEAEQRLRDSEAVYRGTFDLAALGIAHVSADSRFLKVNRALCEMTGYEEEELLRMRTADLSHPDDKTVTHAGRAELHAGRVRSYGAEKRFLRKDGSVIWIAVRSTLVRSSAGEVRYDIGMFEDISARKRAEEALRESEARFRSLTELSSDWYWEQDSEGRFTRFEGRGENLASYLGRTAAELGFEPEAGWDAHEAAYRTRQPFRDLVMGREVRGERRYLSVSAEPVFSTDGRCTGYRGVARDITDRKQAAARIEYLATHDGLTGLPNRVSFSQLLNVAIETARRYKREFAVLFIDLDRFKIINDTLGHEAGDVLLKEIAARLKGVLRASDVVARLGGDEFVALVQEVDNTAQIATVARKVLAATIKPVVILGQECGVTASIGICMYPTGALDEQSLMKNADIAMYAAKAQGKNNYQFYSADALREPSEKRARLEPDPGRARR